MRHPLVLPDQCRRRKVAHLLVALLTAWWTIGIGNVLYAAYCYFGKSPKKVVRDEMAGRLSEDEYSATADPIEVVPGAR